MIAVVLLAIVWSLRVLYGNGHATHHCYAYYYSPWKTLLNIKHWCFNLWNHCKTLAAPVATAIMAISVAIRVIMVEFNSTGFDCGVRKMPQMCNNSDVCKCHYTSVAFYQLRNRKQLSWTPPRSPLLQHWWPWLHSSFWYWYVFQTGGKGGKYSYQEGNPIWKLFSKNIVTGQIRTEFST